MPSRETGGDLNMWYSFEPDPIHFTSISAETDYPGAPPNKITLFTHNGNFGNQLAWPEADLKKAAANRAKVPWIIVAMHRPIYDSSNANNGVPVEQAAHIQAAFEALFIKYKVDVVLTAHEHCYQRLTPIRNNQPVLDGVSSDRKTYNNPKLLFKFCPVRAEASMATTSKPATPPSGMCSRTTLTTVCRRWRRTDLCCHGSL